LAPKECCLLVRHVPHYRRESFEAGLIQAGFAVSERVAPKKGSLLVIWNRYGHYDQVAKQYEQAGGEVWVAENGYLGRDWQGKHWYSLSKGNHNGAGWWNAQGPDRWDGLNVELAPMRRGHGNEVVLLATRHIGPPGVAEPRGWLAQVERELRSGTDLRVRVRPHPGENPATPLERDLKDACAVVTWGSGAALKALLMGIPAVYGFRQWIGAGAGALYTGPNQFASSLRTFGDHRLSMFRRLAWGMWTTEELSTGIPFQCLAQ